MNRKYKNVVDRILSQCVLEDSLIVNGKCWSWSGYVNNKGYGHITLRKNGGRPRGQLVHRVLYQAVIGPIADVETFDHRCLNKRCCNPHHLEPMTRNENTRRARARFVRETRSATTII